MHLFWFFIYNTFVVPLLYIALKIGGLFSEKITRGIQGRKNLFKNLEAQIATLPFSSPRCWFHVSSLGEFEQAKPVIEQAKKMFPNLSVIVSFFSPSGFENVQKIPCIDVICYLPLDSCLQSRKFIKTISPDIAIIVRHDIWPNHVWSAHRFGVYLMLIDASVSAKTMRFWFGVRNFNKDIFSTFSRILAISEENRERLLKIYSKPDQIVVCGDTRYDQVYRRTRETGRIDNLLESGYFQHKRVFVAGSTWPSDEKHVVVAIDEMISRYQDFVAVIVPHEPTQAHVETLVEHFNTIGTDTARFTELNNLEVWKFRVLIVDYMGLLANIYTLGLVAYVGGSFGPGVHNVLEPLAQGCPVLVGPRHLNSYEAQELIKRGACFSVQNSSDILDKLVHLLDDPSEAARVGKIAKEIVMENVGASEKTVQIIKEFLSLTR